MLRGRVAFGGPNEDEDAWNESIAAPTRQFSVSESTSGLFDDSREADERAAEQRLRDLRGRVKAARAAIAAAPGAEEVLRQAWVKAARHVGSAERPMTRGELLPNSKAHIVRR